MAGAHSYADQAISLHQAGRLGEAVILYDQAIAGVENPPPHLLHYAGMAWFGLDKPRKAEPLLKQAAAASNRPDFHLGHGNALYRLKRYKAAAAVLRHASTLDPFNAGLWFNLGNAAEAAGDPDLAEQAFRQALECDPMMTQALANLANLLAKEARYEPLAALLTQTHRLAIWRNLFAEVALIGLPLVANAGEASLPVAKAIAAIAEANPQDSSVAWVLGSLALMQRRFDTAEAEFTRAVDLEPNQLGAKRALGVLQAGRGEMASASSLLQPLVDDDPDASKVTKVADFYIALADMQANAIRCYRVLEDLYEFPRTLFDRHLAWLIFSPDPAATADTAELLERRIAVEESPEHLVNLAATYQKMKRDVPAMKSIRRAIKLDRKNHHAWHNLGGMLLNLGRNPEAYEASKKALKLKPDLVDAVMNCAFAASKLGDAAASERILKRGLKHNPHSAELLNLIGNSRMRRGDMKQALAYFERARGFVESGQNDALFAMQLMAVNYSAEVPPEVVSGMHFRWGDAMIASVAAEKSSPPPPAALKSRLKVGYVSGDYRGHSCSYFLEPLLLGHDPALVEVHCYMTEAGGDDTTQRFRRSMPHWHEIHHLTDQDAADLIRAEGIDILVDLSGHTSGARLPVFARKPAPLQVTWLGYPNTTGLSTVDYRLTDSLADPVGMTESLYREQLYRLPNFLCYQPPEFTPGVGSLPFLRNGYITFGCFNNSNKITDEVVATWSRIMHQVEGSHIFLKTSNLADQLTLDAFRRKFEINGIAAARVECFPSFPNKYDHLITYGEVDLALDPYPYNGTTTTFESLWMGVPMVALEGRVHAGRVGHSILCGAGLPELSCLDTETYVRTAVDLARNVPRIGEYRASLRGQLANSPLMDRKAFAASVENAYFDMWRHAVDQQGAPTVAQAV